MLFRIGLNKFKYVAVVLLFAACSKDDDATPSMEDGKSTVIYDLAGDTKASMMDGVDGKEQRDFYTFLFDLESKRQIWLRPESDSTIMQTDTWDLAFNGPYNSIVSVNNATQESNPGYDGPADRTAIVLLQQSYESVTTAPSDAEFDSSNLVSIGQADNEQSPGWYAYNSSTHVMRPYTNRTYALRLPDGKFAKLQLYSVYKGNPPAVTDMYWPAPYLTFRYYVQPDGSRNLKTN
ncbi:HmuY family protein [Sphingobacterium sp. DN00404]|uniref:HmuY family protein n=1 Tax=Sphingobacterium micropteri TaxID=2763501 RepID=A0ABR7YKT2_9SPHI|nr:HmuY family protein [Sphingobacterium micropteri]MBD1431935.1 HmuY family protein [Sphingobacterium micropteri]